MGTGIVAGEAGFARLSRCGLPTGGRREIIMARAAGRISRRFD
jgi:hypothetical protein